MNDVVSPILAILIFIASCVTFYLVGLSRGYADNPNNSPTYNFNLCTSVIAKSDLAAYYKKALMQQCISQYTNLDVKQQEKNNAN
jgi:hypothetical protein